MKNLIILLLCFICMGLPCFAEYKPIPKELRKQYKAEMEKIIDLNYPIVIKMVDELVAEAIGYYNDIKEKGYNVDTHISIVGITEICIPAADLDLYSKLLKVTKETYLGQKYVPFGTDSVNPLNDFLLPYFKDNNINTRKLKKIIKYEKKKELYLERYLNEIQTLVPKDF